MDKKGVIFDLDGTLVDSMDVWEKADYMLAKKYNFVPDKEYWQTVTSRSFLEGAEYITTRFNLGKTPEEIVKELFDFAYYEYSHAIKLKDGAKELIQKLKKDSFSIAIATSNVKELTYAVLKNNGVFEYFDAFIYCDDIGKNKAHPDIYIAAAKAIGLKPEQCYIFEDVPNSLIGAKLSGAEVIAVYDEYSADKEQLMRERSDRYIMSLKDFKY